jgi:hypothetical protein
VRRGSPANPGPFPRPFDSLTPNQSVSQLLLACSSRGLPPCCWEMQSMAGALVKFSVAFSPRMLQHSYYR